jgi:hypothetical protein
MWREEKVMSEIYTRQYFPIHNKVFDYCQDETKKKNIEDRYDKKEKY